MLTSAVANGDGKRKNGPSRPGQKGTGRGLAGTLLYTLDRLSLDAAASLPHDGAQPAATQLQIRRHLRRAWEDWMLASVEEVEEDSHLGWWWPGGAGNDETGLLLVRSLELCAGRTSLEESLRAKQYAQLTHLTSSLCRKLRGLQLRNISMAECDKSSSNEESEGRAVASRDIEPDMHELIQCALRDPNGGGRRTLQTFLTVAKSFYYVASCPPSTLGHHIAKVLFDEAV